MFGMLKLRLVTAADRDIEGNYISLCSCFLRERHQGHLFSDHELALMPSLVRKIRQ